MTPDQLEGWNGIAGALMGAPVEGEPPSWIVNYARERVRDFGHFLATRPDSYEAGSVRAAIHFLKVGHIQERRE